MAVVRRSTGANPRGHARGHLVAALLNGLASLLLLVTAIAYPLYAQSVDWFGRIVPLDGPLARGLGVASLILAGVCLIWGEASLGGSFRVALPERKLPLVTHGIYRFIRNPLALSVDLLALGVLLLAPSWLALASLVLNAVAYEGKLQAEEAYLRDAHGAAYEAYCERTGRYFPNLWKLRSVFWYPTPTGKVAEHAYAVTARDASMFIYADGAHAIAIDAGYGGEMLRQELQRVPVDPASVTHLFLTHGDVDHTGGLDLFPNAQVYLSQDEEQMIDGSVPRMLGLYHSPRLERPYTLLADGDHGSVGAIEFRAIATPGHTPGSMSYLIDGHVLFTGDTLALRNGRVRTFCRLLNMDTATQQASIRKLARLEKVSLLCTAHTECTTDYALAMRDWRAR